jgi:hypothetical protein
MPCMDVRLAGIAAGQHGLFTTSQALAAAYDAAEIARLLRTGQWTRLRRGIYIETRLQPSDPVHIHAVAARAVLFRVGASASASHVTAAAVHNLAMLEPDLSLVNITRPTLASSRIEAGVHHHIGHIPVSHLISVDGIAVTDVAWSVLDLSRAASFEQGVVTAEAALWTGRTSIVALQDALDDCRDWPGSKNAGRVISFASTGSESPGESLARIAFERQGLPAPEQQVEIRDRAGLIGIADFVWGAHGVIGEFDGRIKYQGQLVEPNTLYAEKRREDRMRELGFEFVRFGWSEVRYQEDALGRRVRSAFARASRRPPVTNPRT